MTCRGVRQNRYRSAPHCRRNACKTPDADLRLLALTGGHYCTPF
jgi:hypothetical protein